MNAPAALALLAALLSSAVFAQPTSPGTPPRNPDAIVNLATREGASLVKAQWRTTEARIVERTHTDRSGRVHATHDIEPRAGSLVFDDSSWAALDADALDRRLGSSFLSMVWYRLNITVPPMVGDFDPTGSTILLDLVIDDYAEVWIDGRLPLPLGQSGGQLISGYNAPNRVTIARDARPGQQIQLAILGINGPLSAPPRNFVWIRSATLDFYRPEHLTAIRSLPLEVQRLDPALDSVIAPGTPLQLLADGFQFTEGPVWLPAGPDSPRGCLLFSDPNANTIYRWDADNGIGVFRTKSGYAGADIQLYGQPGSNGLALDPQGRLTACEHGNRRVTRTERNGAITVLADHFDGKRLNSPNDLVYRSDGVLYFTDPPFGLPNAHSDPRLEQAHSGVYMWRDGVLHRVATDFTGPNGLSFSPDERFLYVTNWDDQHKDIYRYPVSADGSLGKGEPFFSMNGAPGDEALDGLKIDRDGNLFASGPGGVWVISPHAKHLGTIKTPLLPANLAWGGDDGRDLYLTARSRLYRIRTAIPGAAFARPTN